MYQVIDRFFESLLQNLFRFQCSWSQLLVQEVFSFNLSVNKDNEHYQSQRDSK